jgi:Na+-translocating ferredoxin:NAD+ oxidoreductase RnfD subunit
MLEVLLALVPGILAMIWFFGWGVLINIALAAAVAVAAEAAVMLLRRRPVGRRSATTAPWSRPCSSRSRSRRHCLGG